MDLETTGWTGDGDFTQQLLGVLRQVPDIAYIRIEDAPASQSTADYQFLSNEIYVGFATARRWHTVRLAGGVPWPRRVTHTVMTLADLSATLTGRPEIGAPDYADAEMLQYLRTERIVAPYQTRGFKLVEMVRLYALAPR